MPQSELLAVFLGYTISLLEPLKTSGNQDGRGSLHGIVQFEYPLTLTDFVNCIGASVVGAGGGASVCDKTETVKIDAKACINLSNENIFLRLFQQN